MIKDTQETRVKRAHIALMKHPETALYSGVMLMGKTEVINGIPTAYTDGVNKRYGREFITQLNDSDLRGLVLHENLHVALKQVMYGKTMFKENAKMANLAADFVVNDIIMNIDGTVIGNKNEKIVTLPEGGVYDPMFHNWSMREVFRYLKQHAKSGDGGGKGDKGNPSDSGTPSGGKQDNEDGEYVEVNGKKYDISKQDEHDFNGELTDEQLDEIGKDIEKHLREGGLLAGRMGGNVPKTIADLLKPKIDWRHVLREFVTSSMRGKDEYTWRKMNRRQLANDIYLPSVEDETIGEIVVAIDTSGSIGVEEITEFATELVSICETVTPERVRILWWDTKVHGEQIIEEGHYSNIAGILKPLGGGGTMASCVSEYINKERIEAECVLMFTDGYLESDLSWNISSPTLWLVTRNRSFTPPVGQSVYIDND